MLYLFLANQCTIIVSYFLRKFDAITLTEYMVSLTLFMNEGVNATTSHVKTQLKAKLFQSFNALFIKS